MPASKFSDKMQTVSTAPGPALEAEGPFEGMWEFMDLDIAWALNTPDFVSCDNIGLYTIFLVLGTEVLANSPLSSGLA